MRKNNPFDKARCKVAAFDLDGTILNHGVLSENNRRALWTLHHCGVEVVISTGRHYKMIPPEVRELPFIRYVISSSGAHVLDWQNGCDISFASFADQTAYGLAEVLLKKSNVTQIFQREQVLISWRDLWRMSRRLPVKREKNRRIDLLDWAKIVYSPLLYLKLQKSSVSKINAYFEDEAHCAAICSRINNNFSVEAVTTNGRDVEVTPAGITKGLGLGKLCGYLGIDSRETIAFGDSGNDIPILQSCGYAVVMGNAADEVKAMADYVAPSVNEDGAAQAMLMLFS